MKHLFVFFAAILLFACTPQKEKLKYPMTKKVDTVDMYFGHEISDPYRWLEDDMSHETAEWVTAQNEVTERYLEKIPFRLQVKERYAKLYDFPKISTPFHKAGHFYVYKNDGLQNQHIVYVKDTLTGEEKVLIDPNKFSDDGTVALSGLFPSKDGKYVGYGISKAGSDWAELYVREIATGSDLEDKILWLKGADMSWYKDGFFYVRYPEPNEGDELKGANLNSKIYYHKLGTTQSKDELIFEDLEHPEWSYGVGVTDDERFLVRVTYESTSGNSLAVKDMVEGGDFISIYNDFEKDFYVIGNKDDKLLVMTNYDAPKYKIIEVDLKKPEPENWKDFVPEKEYVLSTVDIIGGKVITQYLKDAYSKIEIYNMDGKYLYDLDLPIIGTADGFNGDKEDKFVFYSLTSFTTPGITYKYDVVNNISEKYQETEVDINADDYETHQVFYLSKDGTKIPMFIVHKKGIELDGSNPVLLYGYGGFNISLTPSFSTSRVLWLEQGGVYAQMNLRGGGEYGEDWHKAGTLMNKQNVFDDCIAAAQYLIGEGYTSKGKIALMGGSNGGLLVGAVVNQRPDLFGAAIPMVGVMDMLRYHKFTIGRFWATDYGTSEESEEMFKYLNAYSPIHNIKEGVQYPPIMVTTADHDDRVVPAHSFKYIATLQDKYSGNNPIVIRIEEKAGHGAGKPTTKIIEEYSDIFTFIFQNTGLTPKY